MFLSDVDFCFKTATIWQIAGYVVLVLKIVVPLIIIIFVMVDLVKAIFSPELKVIQDWLLRNLKRIIAAILIFFIPSMVSFIFTAMSSFGDAEEDYLVCVDCVTSPTKKCDTSYKGTIFPE